jgi:hypothetical protein
VGQDPQLRDFGGERLQRRARAVAARIVDEDHLVTAPLEGGGDLAGKRRRGALLIKDGHNDGDIGSRGGGSAGH